MWAACFQALGDPNRILILQLLTTAGRPMTVGQITDAVDIGQSTVSHHLRKLVDVRLVVVDHDRNRSLICVNRERLSAFPAPYQVVLGRAPAAFIAST